MVSQNNCLSGRVKRAVEFANLMHEGQKRKGGDPYIIHPLAVLHNVLNFKKSHNIETLLMSACLHDTIEDTNATYYDIAHLFGAEVAGLVLELTTDSDMKNALGKEQYLKIKMKNMTSWALVIKLCDRLDNVSDLAQREDGFRERYTCETIEIVDYLFKNRKLSLTHLRIIEQILLTLLRACKDNKRCELRLGEMIGCCKALIEARTLGVNNLARCRNKSYAD
ncbi:MAG: HD domain-containing protein [Bacilli bacterium]|nr:HD domain-containing protein [Bacilli bacterium]